MAFITLVPPIVTNVMQYGAVGDGVTVDDSKIALALAAIPTSTGGALYFPPNHTFITQSGIDISAYNGNLLILGGGWSSVLKLANGANTYIIKNISGAQQGTKISNLKLDCNAANQTSASGGIYGYKYRRCLIDFCWIHNPWQAGIYLIGDSGDFGYQNRITNNFIEGGSNTTSGTNAYGNGLRMENTDEPCWIAGNHFENNGNFNDGTFGFHIYDKNGLSSYLGNSFVNGAGVLKLDGHQCSVVSNKFDGNGGAFLQINSAAEDTIVTNNHAINIGYRASGGSANSINGIYVNAPRCIIKENYFESDGSATPKTNSFVNIDTGAVDLICEDNQCNIKAGSGTVLPISFVSGLPTRARVRNMRGYNFVTSAPAFVTENYGSASITSGNTSIAVSHGLSMTPTLNQISVTPQTSLGSAGYWYVSGVTSSQFTINVNTNPGQTVIFGWIAQTGW
jgi:hypothetical protein